MGPPQRRSSWLPAEQQPTQQSKYANKSRASEGSSKFAERKDPLGLDANAICNSLNSHRSFQVKNGYEMNDLPKFNDTTAYGVSEAREQELWEKEVNRLAKSVNSQKSGRFEGEEFWFGSANGEGYTRLHKVAVQLQLAIAICVHDDELIFMESAPEIANYKHYGSARRRLLQEFNPEEGKERYKRSLRLQDCNDESFHSLIDYVTETITRVLLSAMGGEFWVNYCVTTIAKFAAKLKILVFNLTGAATTSLDGTKEVIRRMNHEEATYKRFNSANQELTDHETPLGRRQEALRRDVIDAGGRYFFVMGVFHHNISSMISSIANELGTDERTGLAADIFETSVAIYETGVAKRRALLCQERHGSIGASIYGGEIYCASVSSVVCLKAWKTLQAEITSTPSSDSTTISWKSTRVDGSDAPDTGEIRLQSMNDVVSAIVPYFTVCGEFAGILNSLSGLASTIADPANPVLPFPEYEVLGRFVVNTSAYKANKPKFMDDPDVSNVSSIEMARNLSSSEGPTPRNRIDTGMRMMDSWLIDEKCIIIPYKRYAWGVLAGCAVVVVGGLAIGLSVETRITGVDPFNISVFCWAIAGFIILFAKSIRVENWPWRDFLRGRVICRSVSEVHAVTGIDNQHLLSILLRFDGRMMIGKRGPFHTVFSRKADDGFSIDVPLRNSTMMEAGIIFIKVQSHVGPALVNIAASGWSSYNSVSPLGHTNEKEDIICRDFMEPGSWLDESKWELYTLCTNDLQWFRVYGIFVKEVVFT